MHSTLRDHQLKINTYIYGHHKQKPVTDTKIDTKIEKKESKHNIKVAIKSQGKAAKEEKKRTTKTTPKQLTKWQKVHTYQYLLKI